MKNYTDLNIILDRSVSMTSIANDMIGGIKTFLDKEKATGDETEVSFYQFDDKYDVNFINKDIKDYISINNQINTKYQIPNIKFASDPNLVILAKKL